MALAVAVAHSAPIQYWAEDEAGHADAESCPSDNTIISVDWVKCTTTGEHLAKTRFAVKVPPSAVPCAVLSARSTISDPVGMELCPSSPSASASGSSDALSATEAFGGGPRTDGGAKLGGAVGGGI